MSRRKKLDRKMVEFSSCIHAMEAIEAYRFEPEDLRDALVRIGAFRRMITLLSEIIVESHALQEEERAESLN